MPNAWSERCGALVTGMPWGGHVRLSSWKNEEISSPEPHGDQWPPATVGAC